MKERVPAMTKSLASFRNLMVRLYRDERGAEGLEKVLIIGAIVLPLLGLLIIFRNDLTEWVKEIWTGTQDDADSYDPTL